MKKLRVLVFPSDRAGVGSYRSIEPHLWLERMYPEEFKVTIDYAPNWNDDNFIKQFDLIHCHRTLCEYDKMDALVKKINSFGIPVMLDLDDYWQPGKNHPAYHLVIKEKMGEKIKMALRAANYVTTTTKRFKQEIEKLGVKNVLTFPNAIDPNCKNFTPNPEPSDLPRVGWLGGSSHLKDLEMLTPCFQSLTAKYKGKFKSVLCGWDKRGTITELQPDGGQTTRPVQPLETCWYKYEQIMTDNFKLISDKEYVKFLHKFKQEPYQGEEKTDYRRVWTKPLSTYATNYNLFDISLAPLVDNDGLFNYVKSPLKVMEAGFHKKALIATDIDPYSEDIIHGVNGFLVKTNKPEDWAKHIKFLIDNPEKIKEMGEALYNTVKDKYDIRTVTKTRRQVYIDIISEFKQKQNSETKELTNA